LPSPQSAAARSRRARFRKSRIPLLIALVGFALRAAPLAQNRFHPDEALYATFARLIASGRDPLLATLVVDKPPLPFYLSALSMALIGPGELAARLPTLFASLISIVLLYQLGAALYNRRAGRIAAFALACSPMAILFAITLFTDTLLAVFLLASLLMAVRRRPAWASLHFGLAFASKQTAVFFLPLIIALGLVQLLRHRDFDDSLSVISVRSVVKTLWPALLCIALVFLWDIARHTPISFWAQGYNDNNPGRLIRANEFWPRLVGWLDLVGYLTGSRLADLTLILGLPVLLLFSRRSTQALYDFTLSGFSLAFLTFYWLFAFNVWDRYLLILTPLVALLFGRVLDRLACRLSLAAYSSFCIHHSAFIIVSLFIVSLFIPSTIAARSGFAIGGDHGAYDGIDQIARTLRSVPAGSVLYDFWLSWQWGYYLFDAPIYVAWMPGPGTLADDLRAFGRTSPRYIVAPSWESFAEARAAIESAGFTVEAIQTAHRRDGSLSFTLYRIWYSP
jgi:4-amino-4-deoxy-L-arabinose transferase-like glycosyltransferase